MNKKPVYHPPMLFKRTANGKTQTWEIWVNEGAGGEGVITTRYGHEGGKLQTVTDTVTQGKNAGRKNGTTPLQQAVAEAKSAFEEQLKRKGYGRTVEDSAAVRALAPMLAKNFKDYEKKIDWATCFAQPKLDGFRCLARRGPDGAVLLSSREGLPFNRVLPHIVEAVDRVLMGDRQDMTLDGEVYVPGGDFSTQQRAIKKLCDESYKVVFHVYDVVETSLPFDQRYLRARDALAKSGVPDGISLVKTVKVRSREDLIVVQSEAVAEGLEGAMLRHSRAGYEAGKLSLTLLKVKTYDEEEFEVIDAKEGRGPYKGMAVFVCQTAAGHEFDCTAPGTLDEKRAYWDNYQQYIGRNLTVKFFGYTTTTEPVPRFPVAKAFRD